MQAVDEPVLEFLRQHDLALRQVMLLPQQHLFARERGLQFGRQRVMLLVGSFGLRTTRRKGIGRPVWFARSLMTLPPLGLLAVMRAGNRQALESAPAGRAGGKSQRTPHPDWHRGAADPGLAEGADPSCGVAPALARGIFPGWPRGSATEPLIDPNCSKENRRRTVHAQ